MLTLVKRFWKEEEGLETVEYAIILGLIVAGTIATIALIGGWVGDRFTETHDALTAEPGEGG